MKHRAEKILPHRRPDAETLLALREKARLDRDRADAARAQFELERERGLHVLRSEVIAEMHSLGSTVKSILLSWSGSLPPKVEGLPAAEIAAIVRTEAEKVLQLISESKLTR
jgi:hypothetical protein